MTAILKLSSNVCIFFFYVPGSDSGDILFLPCLFIGLLDNLNIGHNF